MIEIFFAGGGLGIYCCVNKAFDVVIWKGTFQDQNPQAFGLVRVLSSRIERPFCVRLSKLVEQGNEDIVSLEKAHSYVTEYPSLLSGNNTREKYHPHAATLH